MNPKSTTEYVADEAVRLDNFPKYVRRQSLTRFLARYELFKLQAEVKGSIVECGVHHGGGLMAWAKLSAGLEPYALDRRVIGFDSFEGFPAVSGRDAGEANAARRAGGFAADYDVYAELSACIKVFDTNRTLSDYPKVELVRGDACRTIPQYVQDRPHLLVSLLFMDFDLYEPTRAALEYLVPRMPAGAVLAFDEVNNPWWPGETQALLEVLDLRRVHLRRFPFDPSIAYAVIGATV